MNYATIKKHDIANGPGVRVSLFVSGCTHHCKGCFNPETWDFNYGSEFTPAVQDEILEALKKSYIRGFSLLGGEPFEPANQAGLSECCSLTSPAPACITPNSGISSSPAKLDTEP